MNEYTLAFLDCVYKKEVCTNTNVLLNMSVSNLWRSRKYIHYDNKEFLLHTYKDHALWFNVTFQRLSGMNPLGKSLVQVNCWLQASHSGWLYQSQLIFLIVWLQTGLSVHYLNLWLSLLAERWLFTVLCSIQVHLTWSWSKLFPKYYTAYTCLVCSSSLSPYSWDRPQPPWPIG